MNNFTYRVLADAVLVVHVGVVLFVVGGLVLIFLGGRWRWRWVRNLWVRVLHLGAIACVAAESWLGIVCPLTTLEQWARERGGLQGYRGDFIAFWLGKLLFYEAPPWMFIVAYSLFGLLVAVGWMLVRPDGRRARNSATHR
jgi:hypothetical protein